MERARTESLRMRHELDRAGADLEKLQQQCDYNESMMLQREQERQQYQGQISELKAKLQSEQTEQHFLKGENNEMRNEIMMIKSQLNISNNVQEQLRSQVFDLKEKVNDTEHREYLANSSKDMMQREIQQLRSQLSQAN